MSVEEEYSINHLDHQKTWNPGTAPFYALEYHNQVDCLGSIITEFLCRTRSKELDAIGTSVSVKIKQITY